MKNTLLRIAAILLALGLCLGGAVAETNFLTFNEDYYDFSGIDFDDDDDYDSEGYVKSLGKINVRKGPGLGYKSLDTIVKGKHLPYLGELSVDDRGVVWYLVEYKTGKTGWVSSTYAELHEYELYVMAVAGQSNIRKQPNLNGKRLETLLEGDMGLYLNQSSVDDRGVVWYKVRYEDVTGWVSSKYTMLGNGDLESRYIVADEGSTKIRDLPNLSGEYLGELKKGQEALYMESSSVDERGVRWYRILYKDINGWVSSRYTSIED